MKDGYLYGAGTGNNWVRTLVVEDTLLKPHRQATPSYEPPPRSEYSFVPEAAPSGVSRGLKVAGLLGALAAAAVAVSQAKRRDEKP